MTLFLECLGQLGTSNLIKLNYGQNTIKTMVFWRLARAARENKFLQDSGLVSKLCALWEASEEEMCSVDGDYVPVCLLAAGCPTPTGRTSMGRVLTWKRSSCLWQPDSDIHFGCRCHSFPALVYNLLSVRMCINQPEWPSNRVMPWWAIYLYIMTTPEPHVVSKLVGNVWGPNGSPS